MVTLEDINKIPLLDKYIIRDSTQRSVEAGRRPFHEFTIVPEEAFVTVHKTSGTTGVPLTQPFTEPELTFRGIIASGEHSARGFWAFGLRPGDITMIDDSPCPSGRTHLRLLGIKGRWAERLKVNGKPLYFSQVEEAMARFKEYKGDFNIHINGTQKVKTLEIALDQDRVSPPLLTGMKGELEKGLNVSVNLKSIKASELLIYPHRSQKVIDLANLDAHRKELKTQKKVEA